MMSTNPNVDTTDMDDIDLDPSDFGSPIVLKRVPNGDVFEASRAGDVDRLSYLLDTGVNVNARDRWDSVALYYACLAGHLDAARMLLESGAICAERTFDGDRCHYAALNLKVRKLLKAFEARPPPLPPLQADFRDTFVGCPRNREVLPESETGVPSVGTSSYGPFPPDVVFFIQGRPIEAHRVILSARSPFFKKKFQTEWRERSEVRFSKEKLSYPALYCLVHFFYSDRLEIAVDDMEDLVRICKVCKCDSLQRVVEKDLIHQRYADYKALREVDNSQKRFILQGLSLPEEDRLPFAMNKILQLSLANSPLVRSTENVADNLVASIGALQINYFMDDLADVCVRVDQRIFHCHQVVLASRSEYFKARLSRMKEYCDDKDATPDNKLPCLEEHDLSMETFEKMIEYMYTDRLTDIALDEAEEMFDAASRYLLFPLKRAVADVLLPHLEMVSPAELCHWLMLSDMYGVAKLREYCLDTMACNFNTFADTREFRSMLLTLPPPSGDSSLRTTAPSAPGAVANTDEGNLLDDLREKWLEADAAELDKRDESALVFDKRLEMLMQVAELEKTRDVGNSD